MRRPLAALLFAFAAVAHGAASAFGFEDVDMLARERAARPFAKPSFALPKPLKELNYDQERDIRFDPARSHWRAEKLPFELQFSHLGGFFDQPVRVHEIVGNDVREVEFDPADFNYGKNKLDKAQLGKLGHAGFRVHYALNTPAYKDELAVFLGASYLLKLMPACVVCGDTTPHLKPHPAPLLHAAGLLALPPQQCLYLGDDLRDIQGARAAGMRAVAVDWGYHHPASGGPGTWQADAVISQPKDVIGLL